MSQAGIPVLRVDCDWIHEVVTEVDTATTAGGDWDRRSSGSCADAVECPAVE